MIGLFCAALGLAVAFAADLGLARLKVSRVRTYLLALAGGFAIALMVCLLVTWEFGQICVTVVAYGTWWFILLNLIQGMESSIRAQILRELRRVDSEATVDSLLGRYNDNVIVRLRLDRLMSAAIVVEREGRLFVQPGPVRRIALLFRFLKVVILRRESEFGPELQ